MTHPHDELAGDKQGCESPEALQHDIIAILLWRYDTIMILQELQYATIYFASLAFFNSKICLQMKVLFRPVFFQDKLLSLFIFPLQMGLSSKHRSKYN